MPRTGLVRLETEQPQENWYQEGNRFTISSWYSCRPTSHKTNGYKREERVSDGEPKLGDTQKLFAAIHQVEQMSMSKRTFRV